MIALGLLAIGSFHWFIVTVCLKEPSAKPPCAELIQNRPTVNMCDAKTDKSVNNPNKLCIREFKLHSMFKHFKHLLSITD